jgi:hypothetical protein
MLVSVKEKRTDCNQAKASFCPHKNVLHKVKSKPKMLLSIVFTYILMSHSTFGQLKATTVQSVFIYSATKYMEWPDNDLTDFTIIILGDTPLYDELVRVSKTKKAGNRNMTVRKISTPSEITKCNILFITAEKVGLMDKIMANTNEAMLVVTESEGAIDKGSDLNFIQRGDKMTFQIGEKSLANKKIKVSTTFATLAWR